MLHGSYSGLMLASLTILLHFAVSLLIIAANSAGELAIGSPASAAGFVRTPGCSSARAISFCKRSTMAGGIPAGATMLYHDVTSNPGNPDSSSVGSAGAAAIRFGLATARGRNLPDPTYRHTQRA